jgi:hypothetical protein
MPPWPRVQPRGPRKSGVAKSDPGAWSRHAAKKAACPANPVPVGSAMGWERSQCLRRAHAPLPSSDGAGVCSCSRGRGLAAPGLFRRSRHRRMRESYARNRAVLGRRTAPARAGDPDCNESSPHCVSDGACGTQVRPRAEAGQGGHAPAHRCFFVGPCSLGRRSTSQPAQSWCGGSRGLRPEFIRCWLGSPVPRSQAEPGNEGIGNGDGRVWLLLAMLRPRG